MFALIRANLKYSKAIPLAIDLIESIVRSVNNDGTISKRERSELMTKYHALIRSIQDLSLIHI